MNESKSAFSIQQEIQRLTPAELDPPLKPSEASPPLSELWDQVTKNLARLGKQQLRANQTVDFVEQQARDSKEQAEEYRRENFRLREQAQDAAKKLLAIVDNLDDVAVLSRQRGDPVWVNHLERLTHKTLRVLGAIGLTDISASGEPFNPEEHEALDTVARAPGQEMYQIVEVVNRGFRYHGEVLRRAQVITTR